jgi:hypothetical protein
MKESKVSVGILFEPQIKFVFATLYLMNEEEIVGKQIAVYENEKIAWKIAYTMNWFLLP